MGRLTFVMEPTMMAKLTKVGGPTMMSPATTAVLITNGYLLIGMVGEVSAMRPSRGKGCGGVEGVAVEGTVRGV